MKIVISGYYGFGNLGDEALLGTMCKTLTEAKHEVTVLSHRPERTEAQHNVTAKHRLYGVLPALLACDVFISGGGGLLQNTTSKRSLHYYLGLIRLALRLKKKVLVYGQSIGPLTPSAEKYLLDILQNVSGIAVRDSRSYNVLESHSVTATLIADPALLIKADSIEPELIKPNQPKPLLIIPRQGYPEIQAAMVEILPTIADNLRQKHVPLAALALAPEQDNEAVLELKQVVPELEIWHAPTPALATARMKQAYAVLSVRLHGLILAAAADIPFAGIAYDPKVSSFLKDAHATSYHLPQDKQAVIDDFTRIPYVAWNEVDKLKARAQKGLDWLLENIDSL